MNKKEKADTSKTTHDKPISLHPLEYEDALRGLLSVKPPKDTDKRKASKTHAKRSDTSS